MSAIAIQSIVAAGISTSYQAATSSDTIPGVATGQERLFIHAKNSNAATATITINAVQPTSAKVPGVGNVSVPAISVVIPATTGDKMIGRHRHRDAGQYRHDHEPHAGGILAPRRVDLTGRHMANKARGFVSIDLGERSVDVALGLGALAELEDAFQVESFEDALNFGEKMSAGKLLKFVLAVVRGNGVTITEAESAHLRAMSVGDFMAFIKNLMEASGMSQEQPAAKGGDAGRPLGAKNAGKRG